MVKEKHQQCLRRETCSKHVPEVELGFVGNGADEFNVARDAWQASAQTALEASTRKQSAEEGNVKSGYMESQDRELVDSGSGTRADDGERRRRRGTTTESERIFIRQGKNARRISKEELKKWADNRDSDAYITRGGRIVAEHVIDQLEDGAIVRLVNRLPGGRRGKKKKTSSKYDVSMSEESSSSMLNSEQSPWVARFHEAFREKVSGARHGRDEIGCYC